MYKAMQVLCPKNVVHHPQFNDFPPSERNVVVKYAKETKWRDTIAGWMGFCARLRWEGLLHRSQQQENDLD
ncbi:unnamed protein product [Timema podura]|uniref:Uncharacterized protein n=1 Tax=Timema podura TaxID=61482 RepID=A0ABN7PI98_TIMPD|nr:unnamed protein product [Timema podura]